MKKFLIWFGALVVGAILGSFNIGWMQSIFDVIATVYTRLFQFLAVPVIALAVITTLAMLGKKKETGRIFLKTLTFTLLTTLAAALVGLALYLVVKPGNLPLDLISGGQTDVPSGLQSQSYADYLISVVPNNIVTPFSSGNVLSILLIAAAMGLALAFMPETENKNVLVKAIGGLQELFFAMIKALVWTLPVGIIAFAAQLSAQISAGVIVGSLGKYVAVIIGGNMIQFFVILPLFLLANRLNPLKVLKAMSPAVIMALFTKSSAATLPVTIQSAEERLGVDNKVSRFVLPICTTVNMNGCAAFILVTSLFVMQNGCFELSLPTMLLWVLIAVISAVGNAGVPMGCYFLTLSLMTGQGAPIAIMGIILPIYTIIDMVETAENVWSDSCVCAIVNRSMGGKASGTV